MLVSRFNSYYTKCSLHLHLRQKVNSQQTCSIRNHYIFLLSRLLSFSGLYEVLHALDIEWIMIKGVSEYADGSSVSSDSWRRFASAMAASFTVNMLSEPIVIQTWPHYTGEA